MCLDSYEELRIAEKQLTTKFEIQMKAIDDLLSRVNQLNSKWLLRARNNIRIVCTANVLLIALRTFPIQLILKSPWSWIRRENNTNTADTVLENFRMVWNKIEHWATMFTHFAIRQYYMDVFLVDNSQPRDVKQTSDASQNAPEAEIETEKTLGRTDDLDSFGWLKDCPAVASSERYHEVSSTIGVLSQVTAEWIDETRISVEEKSCEAIPVLDGQKKPTDIKLKSFSENWNTKPSWICELESCKRKILKRFKKVLCNLKNKIIAIIDNTI